MKQYVFPAVLHYFAEEDVYTAAFPDMNVYCEGDSVEDTFKKAKNFLQAYCLCSLRLGNPVEVPTTYLETVKKYPENIVLLVDCEVKEEDAMNNDNFFDDMFED